MNSLQETNTSIMENDKDISSAFKEETWGKTDEGEYIIDGYSFKGRRMFRKAIEGIKDMMKKGAVGELNGIKFKVLDTRTNGAGLDVEVELMENKNRGIAVLKIYGPNTKKKNVLTVTKRKGSDAKYLIILAEQVIKPLINKFLEGEETAGLLKTNAIKQSVSVRGKEVKLIKCPHCDKTSYSLPGLKCHITKMHKTEKLADKVQNQEILQHNSDIYEEANKVVKHLLDNVIDLTDGDEDSIETIEEVTLVETCAEQEENIKKKYQNECENCNYVAEESKRYIALQSLKRHRGSCCGSKTIKYAKQCGKCDFKEKDYLLMRRHMRDVHDVITGSTSPPPKRKRRISNEPMETEVDNVKDISFRLEDMDIDSSESEIESETSKFMDNKITEKEESNEEKERLYHEQLKQAEEKKRAIEESKLEQTKLQNKKRKQQLKDQRKSFNKKNKKICNAKTKEGIKVRNLRDVPANCKHLVKEDDVLYVVPGDGACAPNCAAAFLFLDEGFGPKLRRKMNIFMAKHWNIRYKFITQCSEDHPFERRLKGNVISYKEPEELLEYLLNSEEASLMWSDSEDLSIIADMYQIRIKIITSKGNDDLNPTVNWITPEPSMKQFAELKDVELDDLILFHEDETHYNLIVSNKSELAQSGSLSYRFNIASIVNEIEVGTENEKHSKHTEDAENRNNTIEHKKCNEIKSKLETEYFKCEKELRDRTEEVEKLKIEVDDLKEILKLKDELQEIGLDESAQEEASNVQNKNDAWKTANSSQKKAPGGSKMKDQYNCESCKVQYVNKTELQKHMKEKHLIQKNSEEFKCDKCDFVGSSKHHLNKHYNLKHAMKNVVNENQKKGFCCDICIFQCTSQIQLKSHMHIKHSEFNCDECDFQGTSMFQLNKHTNLKHAVKGQMHEEVIKCRNCDEQFSEKWNLMNHRKLKHIETIAFCKNKLEGNCPFSDQKCWWNHQKVENNKDDSIKCYVCDELFEARSSMMKHRKVNHPNIIRKCFNYLQNRCNFTSSSCWFSHDEERMETKEEGSLESKDEESMETEEEEGEREEDNIEEEEEKEVQNNENESVFQKVVTNVKPPINKEKMD